MRLRFTPIGPMRGTAAMRMAECFVAGLRWLTIAAHIARTRQTDAWRSIFARRLDLTAVIVVILVTSVTVLS